MTYAESAAWAVPAPRVITPDMASGVVAAMPRKRRRDGWGLVLIVISKRVRCGAGASAALGAE